MRVIVVTGGRTFGIVPRGTTAEETQRAREVAAAQSSFVRNVLGAIHKTKAIDVMIQGNAPGADTLSKEWAMVRGVHVLTFVANWDVHGRAAGPIRNAEMVRSAAIYHRAGNEVVVIAFPGGKGTANMVGQCRRAGLDINDQTNWRGPHLRCGACDRGDHAACSNWCYCERLGETGHG